MTQSVACWTAWLQSAAFPVWQSVVAWMAWRIHIVGGTARGELILSGGRVPAAQDIIRETLRRWGRPLAIALDRWRLPEIEDAAQSLLSASVRIITRGQGWRDGGQDTRIFDRAFQSGNIIPVQSLLLAHAVSNARLAVDPAGNRKLAKLAQGRARHLRDDAAVAAIMAVSAATLARPKRTPLLRLLPLGSAA